MNFSTSLKTYILDVMEGRRKGRPLLHFLSYLYQVGVVLRNRAYNLGLLKAKEGGIPVISVGNVVAGGTGKTPLVRLLAESLRKDFKVAVVSRGYRSTNESSGKNCRVTPAMPAEVCGDEPRWLAQQLPDVQIWVGRNRYHSVQLAREGGAEVVIMDDGMQHRQLKRDFEIGIVSSQSNQHHFLPRGYLRDEPHRIKQADLVVAFEGQEAPVTFTYEPTLSLQGKRVAAFCAIGHPERFIETIQKAGGEVVATFFKGDHDPFSAQELERFAKHASADLLVCTEKDAVKLPEGMELSKPWQTLPVTLRIVQGEAVWEQFLNRIKERIYHDRRVQSHTP